jgi:ferrous iron transport protein B
MHEYQIEKKIIAEKKLVLIGNPNVGKSVIFNHLTGKYVTVSNYPGTTVDISRGIGSFGLGKEKYTVMDSPGVNSLHPHSEDEEVARNLLLEEKPDLVVQVADAKNLRRALHLTFELAELEIPVILGLNMHDEAKERGIRINIRLLEKLLGIPVVPTVAITGDGIGELKNRIPEAKIPNKKVRYSPEIEEFVKRIEIDFLSGERGNRGIGLMLLAGDMTLYPYLNKKLKKDKFDRLLTFLEEERKGFVHSPDWLVFNYREREAIEIISQVQEIVGKIYSSLAEKLGKWTMRPFPGYLILLAVIYLMYKFVGEFAAGTIVNFLEEKIFQQWINPFFTKIVVSTFPLKFIQEFLVGEYGIFTMALTYALAIIFPIVTAFFLFFGLLEDSGYLPRLSVMLDRVFRLMGLNGKAVLPMVLGLGCDTMAVLSARILDTKKERLIVSILLALAVPCSAQLGVILAMLGGLSWKATVIWLGVIIFFLVSVGWLSAKILPGITTPFFVEIPPIRRPSMSNILAKVKMRLVWYLKEAVPLFILGTLVLFLMNKLKILNLTKYLMSPVVVHWAGLPVKTTEAFIVGFLRRDYGAAGLYALAKEGLLNPQQIVVSLVIITLFVPCLAQFLVTIRERGLKTAAAIFFFTLFIAFFAGGLLNFILSWVKII